MYTVATQFDALPFLYHQQLTYSVELAQTTSALRKVNKKLEKAQRKLGDQLMKLQSIQIRKLWWTCSVARQSIKKLETEQTTLLGLLQQCHNLISSYDRNDLMSPLHNAYSFYPATPFLCPTSPWPIDVQQPQYWDLSMLEDKRNSPLRPTFLDMSSPVCDSIAEAVSISDQESIMSMPRFVRPFVDTQKANERHRRACSDVTVREFEQPAMQRRGVSAAPSLRQGYDI